MNKRPAFQFYPADWLKDTDLQMCSMSTLGIWINLLCRMWESKEEGIVTGRIGDIALLVGAKPAEFKRFIDEAQNHKFCDVLQKVTDNYTIVTIKCRRMNSLFLERERAKMGMRKTRKKQRYENVNLYSSSSTSSSIKEKEIIKEKEKIYPTQKQVIDASTLVGMTEQEAKIFYDHFNAQGWLRANGQPITNLSSMLNNWKRLSSKFQKQNKELNLQEIWDKL